MSPDAPAPRPRRSFAEVIAERAHSPVSAVAATDELRMERVDLPCEQVGWAPPPCAVHLRFVAADGQWSLLGRTAPGRPKDVALWLDALDPEQVQVDPGLAPRTLRAFFDDLPAPWDEILGAADVRHLQATPEGTVSLFVEDVPERLAALMRVLKDAHRREVQVDAPDLTHRQEEAMALAVAMGYYEVPHRVSLRDVAQRMGMSTGATSELLRRGESALITRHFDQLAAKQWTGADARVGRGPTLAELRGA